MEFKKSTKIMIDDLLMDSKIDCSIACIEENINKRKHYYERYRRLLHSAMIRSEGLAQNVQSILILIVEKDPKLSVKYKIFLTTAIITPIFSAGVIIGLTTAHVLPLATCSFTLSTAGIAGVAIGGGILLLITAWLVYKTIQTKRFDWKKAMGELSEAFRDILRRYFPYLENFFSQGHEKAITDDQLQKSLLHSLECIQVDENTWLYDDSLNDLKIVIEETLIELDEDHSIFEQSCSCEA
ncbi:unnamed protein product [Rotaria sp. Silwood2]|nr:unnamed protein product [Rotaria sp. Silwood2]CAF3008515.1 unnamed protein product [Rotaria sp. Silwood2]CAF3325856.1 unnamed protein product [Rotaria sp. Silwood2]CAF3405059.1 unnamed protein product [Rotaria sp. Silwood2]CAF4211290.1 unnamed protein product [Rotaria sp. Silwood2]